jgi:hypothetical protein
MKRSGVVWRSSAEPLLLGWPGRRPRPRNALPRALRRALRTGVLLALFGLIRLAGNPRWRSAVLGAALIIPGVLLRNIYGNIILLPGLMILFYAPFLPGDSPENRARQASLRRDLAAYSSPADRRDLEAIIDRYPAAETGELRAVLTSLRTAPLRNPGMGPR